MAVKCIACRKALLVDKDGNDLQDCELMFSFWICHPCGSTLSREYSLVGFFRYRSSQPWTTFVYSVTTHEM